MTQQPRLFVRDMVVAGVQCSAWLIPHPDEPTGALFELVTQHGTHHAETLQAASQAFLASQTEAPLRRGLLVFLEPHLEVEEVVYRTRVGYDGSLVYRPRPFADPDLLPSEPLALNGYGADSCFSGLAPFLEVLATPGKPFRHPAQETTLLLDSEDPDVAPVRALALREEKRRTRFSSLSVEDALRRMREEADYHWKNRAPTPAEVAAHGTEVGGGAWAVRERNGEATVVYLWTEDGVTHCRWHNTANTSLTPPGGSYRPLSRKTLGPEFWPTAQELPR